MGKMDYQRSVVGYHGCDEQVAHDVLLGRKELIASDHNYDWLGKGIYFWENGPQRAFEWAIARTKTSPKIGKITKPTIIGAYIHLGVCFDQECPEYIQR